MSTITITETGVEIIEIGTQGPPGVAGSIAPITTATTTNLNGILKGDGTHIGVATDVALTDLANTFTVDQTIDGTLNSDRLNTGPVSAAAMTANSLTCTGDITGDTITANSGIITDNLAANTVVVSGEVTTNDLLATDAITLTTDDLSTVITAGTITQYDAHDAPTSIMALAGFSGVGTNLTALNANNISSGTLDHARLANVAFTTTPNAFTTGQQTFNAGASGTIPLVVKGAISQSANLQEWRDTNSTVLASISNTGVFSGLTGYASLSAANTFTVGPQQINVGSMGNKGLIIKAVSGLGANLQEWQNSSGTALASVSSTGMFSGDGSGLTNVVLLNAANTFTVGPQTINTGAVGNKGLIVKAAASQTANLQEWQDSSGNILTAINPTGTITGSVGSNVGTGSAGGNLTLTGGAAGGDGTIGRTGGSFAFIAGASVGPSAAGGGFSMTSGVGGTDATVVAFGFGGNGGAVTKTTGAGGTFTGATTNGIGGSGGAFSYTTGAGANVSLPLPGTQFAGGGGNFTLTTGNGGSATANTTGNQVGGAGGGFIIHGGNGGNSSNANATPGLAAGGAGGAFQFTAGSGGNGRTSGGAGGAFQLLTGFSGGTTGNSGTTTGTAGGNFDLVIQSAGNSAGTGTTGIGGNAGSFTVNSSTYITGAGSANGAVSGTNTGGIGGNVTFFATAGGGASNAATSNIGGIGGSVVFNAGKGGVASGTSPTSGVGGKITFFTTPTTGALVERFTILNSGFIGINQTAPTSQLHIVNATATNVGLAIQGAASQSVNIQEWRDSTTAVLAKVLPDGTFYTPKYGVANQSATVSGDPTDAFAVYNSAGTLMGYCPIYAALAH